MADQQQQTDVAAVLRRLRDVNLGGRGVETTAGSDPLTTGRANKAVAMVNGALAADDREVAAALLRTYRKWQGSDRAAKGTKRAAVDAADREKLALALAQTKLLRRLGRGEPHHVARAAAYAKYVKAGGAAGFDEFLAKVAAG